MSVAEIVSEAAGATVYACGPTRLLDALEAEAEGTSTAIKVERFVNENLVSSDTDHAFEVELSITGKTLRIEPGESILGRVAEVGVDAPSSCRGGTCGLARRSCSRGSPTTGTSPGRT